MLMTLLYHKLDRYFITYIQEEAKVAFLPKWLTLPIGIFLIRASKNISPVIE
jgi:hypothetical protein